MYSTTKYMTRTVVNKIYTTSSMNIMLHVTNNSSFLLNTRVLLTTVIIGHYTEVFLNLSREMMLLTNTYLHRFTKVSSFYLNLHVSVPITVYSLNIHFPWYQIIHKYTFTLCMRIQQTYFHCTET